jgi:hypothetical protein
MPYCSRQFHGDQHKTRSKNKKGKEDADAATVATAAKKKDINSPNSKKRVVN